MGTSARGLRVRGASCANASSSESFRELQRKESNLRDDRLTAGCLTIRLRWKNSARRERGAKCSASAVEPVAPSFQRAWATREIARGLVPGTGFEPVFLDSETSVLPARRSRSAGAAAPSRSGGNRTLTTSIKSRVRLPITLRTREARARADYGRACRAGHGEDTSWDARESNPHPSG